MLRKVFVSYIKQDKLMSLKGQLGIEVFIKELNKKALACYDNSKQTLDSK